MFKISWFCGSGLKRFFSYNSITCGRILDFSSSVSKNRPCWTTFRKGQKKFEASFLVKNASKDRFKKHFEFFWTFLVILGMKEASNRFSTFIESCSTWSIFGYRAWKIQNPSTGYEVIDKKSSDQPTAACKGNFFLKIFPIFSPNYDILRLLEKKK